MLSLEGKTALVVGCGSQLPGWGNGKAIAVLFARQGARVFGVDKNLAAAEETCGIIAEEGGQASAHSYDATDATSVNAMVEACLADSGRIDVLVNVVGGSEPGGPVELDEVTWDAQFVFNMKTAYLACKAVLPVMEKQGNGSVVNIASVAAVRYVGKPQVAYSASKAALIQFTRTTGVLYAAKGVRLNCILPGLMHTPLVQRLAEKYAGGDYEGFVAKRHAQVPMGRMGDAWDVAHAALFLASDEAKYVTATELVVDGGFIASTG
jgi:NAD(P)-dependent dehydrogenase (short-subunit alcohol dehydrogenase family)